MKKNTNTKTDPTPVATDIHIEFISDSPSKLKPAQLTFSSYAEWKKEAVSRFGEDSRKWKFICPSCGHIATVQDWKDAGAPLGTIAFSCVGRYLSKRHEAFQKGKCPCNYAGGGLFRINPVTVKEGDVVHEIFDFAPVT